jgi:predicted transposase/invertase (TIGR01784 family)
MPNPLAHLPPDLDLLDPTLDVVFDRFFTDPRHEPLLRDFLTCALQPASPIAKLEVLGQRLPKRHVEDKPFIVDLRVRFDGGGEIIVEMQRYVDEALPERLLGYGARGYAHQLEPGDRHGVAAAVRVVVLLTFVGFPNLGLRTVFHLRDESGRHMLTHKLEVVVIQMPRLAALDTSHPERHSGLSQWIRFFQAKTQAEYAALAAESSVMSRAVEALADLSTDRDLRRIAEDRALALRFHEQAIERRVQAALEQGIDLGVEQGIEQGVAKGREEGREQGRDDERRRILSRILTKRFGAVPSQVQARVDAASPEDLERWADRAIDASTLDEVFA